MDRTCEDEALQNDVEALRKQVELLREALKRLLSSAGPGSLSREQAIRNARCAIIATEPKEKP